MASETMTKKRKDAEAALEAARDAENKQMKSDSKENTNAAVASDMNDSDTITVNIGYKQENREDRILVGAVIKRKGRSIAQRFQVPVNVDITIPVEVADQIRGRKIQKYVGKELRLVNQFTVEKV